MRLWITAGGTREPMDAVRYVGNRSTGRLGRHLIAEAVARGHDVTAFLAAFLGEGADHPCQLRTFETSADLKDALERESPAPDALIHCAAVSDYAPEPQAGKVPSGQDTWTLTLRRVPKVVDAFRARYPEALLVLFKLETGIDEAELYRRARAAAGRVQAQLVFANLLERTADRHEGSLLWMGQDRVQTATGREQIATLILEALEELGRERDG